MFIEGRFHLSSFGESCLDKIFLVARTEETNAELCRQQISVEVEHRRKQLKNCYAPPLWWVGFNQHQLLSQQLTFSSPSQHFLGILLSLLPLTKNLPSTHRPSSFIVVWQQLTCWLVLLLSLSVLLIGCRWFTNIGVFVVTQGMQPTSQAQHYVEFLC